MSMEDFWRQFASCRDVDPNVFFPNGKTVTEEVKELCGNCKVIESCAESAIQDAHQLGFAGGLSEKERRLIRRERSREVSS